MAVKGKNSEEGKVVPLNSAVEPLDSVVESPSTSLEFTSEWVKISNAPISELLIRDMIQSQERRENHRLLNDAFKSFCNLLVSYRYVVYVIIVLKITHWKGEEALKLVLELTKQWQG